jgi:hypothetical protein
MSLSELILNDSSTQPSAFRNQHSACIQPAQQLRVVLTGILPSQVAKSNWQLAVGQTKEQQENQSQLHSTVRNVRKIDSP